MAERFLVVGGDAAGLSAASKAARDDPDRDVIVFERGQWVSYAHCGMPYFVKDEVDTLDDLLTLSPEAIADRGVDLRRGHEVVDVDTEDQTVTVAHDGTQTEEPYDDLLVATGASALTSPIYGTDLRGVHSMHGLDSAAGVRAHLLDPDEDPFDHIGGERYVDRDLVEAYAEMTPPETVAIVGGGYVGIEMAEAFSAHDLDVHLFQRGDRVLPPFGQSVATEVESELADRGVTLHLGTEVAALGGDDAVTHLECSDGTRLSVGMALVGIGIRPNTGLVEDTAIELGEAGAIDVDDHGRTSVENVYAAGDCATAAHAVTGEQAWVPLGLTANRAGRAIGQTVTGTPEPVGDVAGTAVVKAFDVEAGRTGIVDHETARDTGFDPVTETITSASRSGYYPGGADLTVTLTADRSTGRLLGGTLVGRDRAAIRVDILAMALEQETTVAELERADLAYAPPFSPVWDPVLTAAKVLRGSL